MRSSLDKLVQVHIHVRLLDFDKTLINLLKSQFILNSDMWDLRFLL